MFRTLPRSAADDTAWEMVWAPYTENIYQEVLAHIQPEDIVLEIGAGDMRLAARIAAIARQVYAIEIQPLLFEYVQEQDRHLSNLIILNENALTYPFPDDITAAVLLMRHCTHFRLYADKLKAAGCQQLITNARWRTGLEVIQLQAPRRIFDQIPLGWYACWCGNTGFKPGPVEALDEETANYVYEVSNCPNCSE
jgi:SAM-dependent methyltransferase